MRCHKSPYNRDNDNYLLANVHPSTTMRAPLPTNTTPWATSAKTTGVDAAIITTNFDDYGHKTSMNDPDKGDGPAW
jgi:hypothetical protein